MTDTTDVDVDALLAEIFLTTEGKSDPYPRYAAIREHSPVFRSALGFVVVIGWWPNWSIVFVALILAFVLFGPLTHRGGGGEL